MPGFTWRPANEATTEHVKAVFDAGGARKCRCQALKTPGWIWRDTTQEQRDAAQLADRYEVVASPTLRRRVLRHRLGGLPSRPTASASNMGDGVARPVQKRS